MAFRVSPGAWCGNPGAFRQGEGTVGAYCQVYEAASGLLREASGEGSNGKDLFESPETLEILHQMEESGGFEAEAASTRKEAAG